VGWGLGKRGSRGRKPKGRGTVSTAGLSGNAPPKAVFPLPLWFSSPLGKTKIKKWGMLGKE
jgi:hypothetical protein